MKKYSSLLLIGFACCLSTAFAQPVNETVTFDNYVSTTDNDFQNRFDNGPGLNQITSGGITGGCLETPLTENWGNDNAIYCTHFKGQSGETYITGICFKYDTSQLNSINFDRPVTLWLKPSADPNHYAIASLLGSGNIQLVSYSATSSSNVLALQQSHWYVLQLTAAFTGGAFNDQINLGAQVNDLGLTGTDPPIPTGFTNTVLHDSILIADAAIEASVSGTHWGGAQYLDNYSFIGLKSFDNCATTGIQEVAQEVPFSFGIVGNTLTVFPRPGFEGGFLEILNLNGQVAFLGKTTTEIPKYDLSALPNGFYFLSLKNERVREVKKFVLVR